VWLSPWLAKTQVTVCKDNWLSLQYMNGQVHFSAIFKLLQQSKADICEWQLNFRSMRKWQDVLQNWILWSRCVPLRTLPSQPSGRFFGLYGMSFSSSSESLSLICSSSDSSRSPSVRACLRCTLSRVAALCSPSNSARRYTWASSADTSFCRSLVDNNDSFYDTLSNSQTNFTCRQTCSFLGSI